MKSTTMRAVLGALLLATGAVRADAQGNPPPRGGQPPRDRGAMEERLRQRMAQVVQRRLGLTDEQTRRLVEVNARYEGERRQLVTQERELRLQLRDEIGAGDSAADQQRVGRALDRMLAVQRRRLELLEREQKDLGAFLTPVQRAKYLAFQDEARRRIQEAQRRRGMGQGMGPGAPGRLRPRPGAPGPDGPPPGEP